MGITMDGIALYQLADLASGPTPYNTDTVDTRILKSPFGPLNGGQLAGALRLTGSPASERPTGLVDLSAFGVAAELQVPAWPLAVGWAERARNTDVRALRRYAREIRAACW